ncbi:MAG: hypothetical protein JST51_06290 [Armatimonadetes bacterium]|nr:hypothetical protein [Armatimonadota bacterium]
MLSPLAFVVGLAAEAVYMLFVPDSRWYESRLKEKFDAEVQARLDRLRDQVFPQIHESVREQFSRLQSARLQIGQQSRSEEKWFREALRKLDFLLEKYLQFALKESQYIRYLNSLVDEAYDNLNREEKNKLDDLVDRASSKSKPPKSGTVSLSPAPSEDWNNTVAEVLSSQYAREIKDLKDRSEKEQVFATKSILEKRCEILTKRQEFVERIVQILNNLRHQMQLMTDTFGLINDEIRARSPEQVLADIDEVVVTANSLTEAIEAVTPLEQLVAVPNT